MSGDNKEPLPKFKEFLENYDKLPDRTKEAMELEFSALNKGISDKDFVIRMDRREKFLDIIDAGKSKAEEAGKWVQKALNKSSGDRHL
jgi:hypothetical protein